MALAQELFASHRIIEGEPSARNKRIADIVLLLLGAIVGAFAQRCLGPPAGPHPAIWDTSIGEFMRTEAPVLSVLAVLVGTFAALAVIGNRRAEAERKLLMRYAQERPLTLFADTFPALPEVRLKIRDAVRWAAGISATNATSVLALERITGARIMHGEQRRTALAEIEWTILLFDMGIVLGVTLPPMLGIG
jgi:hypothetical protein